MLMSKITIDLREAYAAHSPCLPDIETAIAKLMKATNGGVDVTVLREALELVHAANMDNLLAAIKKGDEEADFLRATLLQMAAPERETPPPDLSKLHAYSNATQDAFIWIVNYRRQKTFDRRRLDTLLANVDAI